MMATTTTTTTTITTTTFSFFVSMESLFAQTVSYSIMPMGIE
jgi:hypothetical protein